MQSHPASDSEVAPPQPYDFDGNPQPGEYVEGPRSQDVASTRNPKWHSHPQNVFYRDLVIKAAPTIDNKEMDCTRRRAAERIVDIIMVDKSGVFVKHQLTSGWIVMSRKEAIIKTQQAIGNYNRKVAQGGWYNKKKKGPSKKKKPSQPPPKQLITYQAQAGDSTSIHPYALLLISAICNASKQQPREALHVLDAPMSQCFDEGGEPRKERTMRLQLRHRYAGALAMGISPIAFSEKLLALWGGSLTKTESAPPPNPLLETLAETASQPKEDASAHVPPPSAHDESSAANVLMSLVGNN